VPGRRPLPLRFGPARLGVSTDSSHATFTAAELRHDTRHTHITWLIEDDIPEIAQARRLGHRLPGIRGVYSHVTPVMIARITTSLQARWQASHVTHSPPPATPARRLTSWLTALGHLARTINRSGF
jgi:hypothetical protein